MRFCGHGEKEKTHSEFCRFRGLLVQSLDVGWMVGDGEVLRELLVSTRTTSSSSTSTMSYALSAPQKMMQVTPSKQWIHFFLSDLWPPTSNILLVRGGRKSNYVSTNRRQCRLPIGHGWLCVNLLFELPEVQFFASELFFNDTSGLDSRPQHILLIRKIVGLADSVHVREVAVNGKFTREHTNVFTNYRPSWNSLSLFRE